MIDGGTKCWSKWLSYWHFFLSSLVPFLTYTKKTNCDVLIVFVQTLLFLHQKQNIFLIRFFCEHGICFIIYVLIIISTYFKKPLKKVFWEEEKNSNLRSIWEGKLWETRMKWNKLKGLAKERLWRDFFLYNIYFLNLDELLFLLE